MARGEIHVQLIVNYGEDPKIRALARFGRDARACRDLYVQMLCYCKRNLTDGYIPSEEVGVLVYPDSPRVGKRDAERLVEVGLAKHTEGGYLLPGFLKRNKSKAQVEAESEKKANAGRKGGIRSGQVRRNSEANTKQSASLDEADGKQPASECLNTEVIGHRSKNKTPPPTPPHDAAPWPTAEAPKAEEEGDSGEQINDLDLIRQVRELRPDWTTGSITKALNRPEVLERPAELRGSAMLAVAKDTASQHPGRLAHDGPWWVTVAQPARAPRPPWCGACDEQTRQIDPDTPRRCPDCHPLRDEEAS
jgi:hypothetical protein